ncbi:hypothetical protein LSAT2_017524 [Lamellibrachia satsuma]|nr:hypothetical protein LSAT2_017524 [Lamellibrachia satsuma]
MRQRILGLCQPTSYTGQVSAVEEESNNGLSAVDTHSVVIGVAARSKTSGAGGKYCTLTTMMQPCQVPRLALGVMMVLFAASAMPWLPFFRCVALLRARRSHVAISSTESSEDCSRLCRSPWLVWDIDGAASPKPFSNPYYRCSAFTVVPHPRD